MNKLYGTIFKNLRLNKGLSIKEVTCDCVSSATISKFENGYSNISIDKFFRVLKNINVSPQEYFTYLEEEMGVSYSVSMINLPLAFDHRNYAGIEALLDLFTRESKHLPHNFALKLQVISVKSLIHQINPEYSVDQADVKLIKQYLLSTKIWNEFEIQLYSRSTYLLDLESLGILTRRLLNPLNYDLLTFEIKLYVYNALVNLTTTLVDRKAYDALKRIQRYIFSHPLPDRYMFQKAILQFNFARAHFHQENKEEAAQEMNRIIKSFETLGCTTWSTRLKDQISELKIENYLKE